MDETPMINLSDTNIIFPFVGKVAIVDDCLDEVKPLMQFLSKNFIPSLYFDGSVKNFPTKKESIQLVFLDLSINNTTIPKMLASGLISNLEALISDDNGPYCLALWSNNYLSNQECINEAILSLKNKPEFWFDMDKSLISLGDAVLFNELSKKLVDGFKKDSLTNLMNNFIRLYETSAINSFNNIDKLLLKDIEDDIKLNSLVDNVLKKEYGNLDESITKEDKLNLFIPILDKYISNEFSFKLPSDFHRFIEYDDTRNQKEINNAVYNTVMNIFKPLNMKVPQNVYEMDAGDFDYEKILTKTIFNKYKIKPEECIPIAIDVTHHCYIANKKVNYHTMVKGLLIKSEDSKDSIGANLHINDQLLNLNRIIFNNEEFTLLVCCNTLYSLLEDDIKVNKAMFSISNQFFSCIRSKVAVLFTKVAL